MGKDKGKDKEKDKDKWLARGEQTHGDMRMLIVSRSSYIALMENPSYHFIDKKFPRKERFSNVLQLRMDWLQEIKRRLLMTSKLDT